MPELPEVETVRRGLEASILGRRIAEVEVRGRRSVRRQRPAELRARLAGRTFTGAGRRGKFLLLSVDDGSVLVVHLRMTGQLLFHSGGSRRPEMAAHTHVVVTFEDTSQLRFVDPRTFGEWFVSAPAGADGVPAELAHLGRDPLVQGLPTRYLADRLATRRAPLKALLTDQRIVAGIGSIYADEICFRARLRPDRPGGSLDALELASLAKAARSVLHDAVRLKGSSLRDLGYRDLAGDLGAYQERHCVYDRAGQPCPRCAAPIVRLKIGARSAYCCEACQL
ncbi:MAG: bifunctional DNA-formamidopyrimidine glycosylase/DNA-(apurinic or apyrimidinic site) lyase [Acidimicrobiales bacterium]